MMKTLVSILFCLIVMFVTAPALQAGPIGTTVNYGIWFDRDGVDAGTAASWGQVNGDTYNTGGHLRRRSHLPCGKPDYSHHVRHDQWHSARFLHQRVEECPVQLDGPTALGMMQGEVVVDAPQGRPALRRQRVAWIVAVRPQQLQG